jgi:hypothetical protein
MTMTMTMGRPAEPGAPFVIPIPNPDRESKSQSQSELPIVNRYLFAAMTCSFSCTKRSRRVSLEPGDDQLRHLDADLLGDFAPGAIGGILVAGQQAARESPPLSVGLAIQQNSPVGAFNSTHRPHGVPEGPQAHQPTPQPARETTEQLQGETVDVGAHTSSVR